jgi:DNA-binding HxlR family transcriptional regulator
MVDQLQKTDISAPEFVSNIINRQVNPEVVNEVAYTLTPEQQAKVDATRAELAAQAGVLETRTQEQIVEDMRKAEEESAIRKAEQMSPADMSAQFWMQFWPMYQANIATLSNKDCKRVLEAIVQWPLENEKPTFNSKQARDAFAIGLRLIDSKTIMRDTVELEMLNKQAMEAQNAKDAEIVLNEQGEIKNG